MKSREQKQKDLNALNEQLSEAKSAIVLNFGGVSVNKDQEFRNHLREAGAKYQVVKNTIARLAVKDTQYSQIEEHFQGMTAIAWTNGDPVDLSKSISKFLKDNKDIYSFKAGMVEGRVVDFSQVESIASLPSKEELIGKLLYLLNAPAQRLATVLNAVPRNLAVALGQIAEGKGELKAPEAEAKEEATAAEEAPAEETATEETAAETTEEATAETAESAEETTEANTEENNAEATSSEETPAESSEEKSEE